MQPYGSTAAQSQFAWHFDAGRRDSDDYEIPGFAHADADFGTAEPGEAFGVLPNSAAESESAAFGASWLGDNGFVGVGINAFDTLYGIPGHAHEEEPLPGEPAPEEEVVRIDLEQRRVDLRGGWANLAGAIEGVNVRLGVNDYEHVELEGDAVGTRFTNDATELRVELLHASVGRWSGAFGVQLGEREFAAVGEEAFVPPVDSVDDRRVRRRAARPRFVGGLARWRVESLEHTPSNDLPRFDDQRDELVVRRRAAVRRRATRSLRRSRSRSACRWPRSSTRTGRILRPASCRSATLR